VELSGTITATELAEIFQLLTTSRKEGTLTVSDGTRKKSIYFSRDGVTLLFDRGKGARSLGQLLVDYGRITEEQLQTALEEQQATGKRLGEVVRETGLVSDEEIEDLVRTQIEEEIFDLLSWRGGTFQFRDEPAPEFLADTEHTYTSLLFDPNSLLVEAARRMDEWERIGEFIRTGEEVFRRREGVEPPVEDDLAHASTRVLPLVDGLRPASELLRVARLPKFEVYSVIYRLYEMGVLELVPPEELSRLAVEAMDAGEVSKGLSLLESAVAQEPTNVAYAKNLGKAHDVAGNRERALELYGLVVRQYLDRGSPGEAEPVLKRMCELAPDSSAVLALEVLAALALGDSSEAVHKCLALLRAAERERSYVEARGVVESVLEAVPDHADLREAVADVLARMGDRRAAVQEYEQVARLQLSRGRGQRALSVYQRILKLDPLNEEARRQVTALGPELGFRRRKTLLALALGVVLVAVVVGGWLVLRPRAPGVTGGGSGSGPVAPAGPGATGPPAPVIEPGETPEQRAARARELAEGAKRLVSEGRLPQALRQWEEAAGLMPDKAAHAEYRRQAETVGRLLEKARTQLNRAQKLEQQGNYEAARKEYLSLCARHDFAVTEFGVTLPIPVTTVPSGAQVLVDGEPRDTTPTVLHLPPFKQFTLALQLPNHGAWSQALSSDTVSAVSVTLPRTPSWSWKSASGLTAGPGAGKGQVFVVSQGGMVRALDAEDGSERWQVRVAGVVAVPPEPAGDVVVLADRSGTLRGLDSATGEERWLFRAGDAVKGVLRYEEALGLIFFGALDKAIYGLEAATGKERWRFATSGNVEASPVLVQGTLLCGSLDGGLYALEAETGRLLWCCDAGGPVATAAVVTEGLVSFANLRDEVVACSLEGGKVLWKYRSPTALATRVHPAAAVVCFATQGGELVGLDSARGTVLWKVKGPERVTSLASAGGRLWVGGPDGSLRCVDGKTGDLLWQAQLDGAVDLPIWVGERRLYVATSKGLWCFLR